MWRYTLYLCCCLFVGAVISATSPSHPILVITDTYKNKGAESAFNIANTYFDEFAGTPDFDALFGQICFEINKIDEAVFALERAVSENPTDYKSFYFLALSYAKQKNLNQSEKVLNTLLTLPIPANLRSNIRETLQLVKNKRQSLESNINQRISLFFGHDSNVNSGSLDDRVVVSGVEILLDEQSLETSDGFARASYDFTGNWKRNQYDAWRLDFNLAQQSHQNLSQYNRSQGNIRFGYLHTRSPYRVSLQGIASFLALDEANYQQEIGMTSNVQRQISKQWAFDVNSKVSFVNNVQNENLDSKVYELLFGVTYLKSNLIAKLTALYGKQDAELEIAEHFGRDYTGIALFTSYNVSQTHTFLINGQYRNIEHHKAHPFFLIMRDETLKSVSLEWRYKLTSKWFLQTRYSFYDKTSTLPIYEFDRNELYLGASYDF